MGRIASIIGGLAVAVLLTHPARACTVGIDLPFLSCEGVGGAPLGSRLALPGEGVEEALPGAVTRPNGDPTVAKTLLTVNGGVFTEVDDPGGLLPFAIEVGRLFDLAYVEWVVDGTFASSFARATIRDALGESRRLESPEIRTDAVFLDPNGRAWASFQEMWDSGLGSGFGSIRVTLWEVGLESNPLAVGIMVPVPEPMSSFMLLIGVVALLVARRSRLRGRRLARFHLFPGRRCRV